MQKDCRWKDKTLPEIDRSILYGEEKKLQQFYFLITRNKQTNKQTHLREYLFVNKAIEK